MVSSLSFVQVSKRFEAGIAGCRASVAVLRAVDLELMPGECLGVVGGAAAGKSTLLLCAAALLRPDRGNVSWFDRWRDSPPRERVVYSPSWAHGSFGDEHPRVAAPRLYLIDDPLRGTGGAAFASLADWVERACTRGGSVIIASRDLHAVSTIVSRAVELRAGALVAVSSDHDRPARARVAEGGTGFG